MSEEISMQAYQQAKTNAAAINGLAGEGRQTETVVGNAAAIASLMQQPVVEVTENRVIVNTDIGKILNFNSVSDLTCTISPDSTLTDAAVSSIFTVMRMGAGAVAFVAGDGVTILSVDSALSISGRYGGVIARKTAANTWVLVGSLI